MSEFRMIAIASELANNVMVRDGKAGCFDLRVERQEEI